MAPRKRLGQLLTELKVIDDHQLQSALGHQRQWGGKLGAILVQKGFCAEEQLVTALAQHLNMERVKLSEAKVDARAVKYVSRQVAEKLHVFPYDVTGAGRSEVISIAMSDPTDLSAVDQLAFHTGKRIKPMLAADSEIVGAIQTHYGPGEEKKEPTDKLRTAAPGAPAAGAAGFPRRIEPQAAAPQQPRAGAQPAPAAPQPAKPAAAAKPDRPEPATPVAPPVSVPAGLAPVDLPEDEGDMGLEPIAAHSQFGDAVSGKEEVAGDGSAGDAIEGLVSASLAFHGTETAAAPGTAEAAWPQAEAPAAEASGAAQDPGWGTPVQSTGEGWGAPAAGSAEGSSWSSEPAAPAADAGWSMEEPATSAGWSAPADEQAWDVERATPADEAPSEVLPTDAILGALEPSPDQGDAGGDSGWGTDESTDAAAPPPAEAEPAAPQASDEPRSQEIPPAGPSFDDAAPVPPSELEPQGVAMAADEVSPSGSADLAPPGDAAGELDGAPATLAAPDMAEEAAADHGPDTEPIPAPSFEPPPDEHEAEAPDAWAATDDPLAAEARAESTVADPLQAAPEEAAPELRDPLADERAGEPPAPASLSEDDDDSLEVDTGSFEVAESAAAPPPPEPQPPEEMSAAPAEPAEAPREWGQDSFDAAPGAEDVSLPREATERFAAQPADWSGQAEEAGSRPGWVGDALQGNTPLSPADLGTLASIGVEPSDGVGALRLLAALVRILNRGQLIEPDELRAEIRESCAAGAAAAMEAYGVESGTSATGAEDPSPPRAET